MSQPKHHIRQDECTSRAPYREGKKPKAVKVYTVNQESPYLLVQGVPAVGATQELVKLLSMHGDIHEHRALDDYPAEQFTEVYLFKYKRIQAARHAKHKLDNWSFYGGVLHVCYAPEYETEQETRWKLQERRRAVAAKTRQYQRDGTYTSTKDHGQTSDSTATLASATYNYPESNAHLAVSPHGSSDSLHQKNEVMVNQSSMHPSHEAQITRQNNPNEYPFHAHMNNGTFGTNRLIPEPNRNIDLLRIPEGSRSVWNTSTNSAPIDGNRSNHRTCVQANQSYSTSMSQNQSHTMSKSQNQSHTMSKSQNQSHTTSWNQSNVSDAEPVTRTPDNGCDQNTQSATDDTQQLILPLPPKENKMGITKHHRQQQFHFAKVPTAQAEFPADFDARLEKDSVSSSTSSDKKSKLCEKDEQQLNTEVEKTKTKSMQEKINENLKKTTGLVIRAVSKPVTAPRFIPRQTQAKMTQKVSTVTAEKSGEAEEANKELRRNAFTLRDMQGPEVCEEDMHKEPDPKEISLEKSRKDIRKRISEVSDIAPEMKKWKKKVEEI